MNNDMNPFAKDEMSADLAKAQRTEEDGKANHVALVAAKEEEIASLMVEIEAKLTWQGDVGVEWQSVSRVGEKPEDQGRGTLGHSRNDQVVQ